MSPQSHRWRGPDEYSSENRLYTPGTRKRIGSKIKDCRREINITQEELARRSGVSRTIISSLESGAITVTTTDTLSKIVKALGKKVGENFFDDSI